MNNRAFLHYVPETFSSLAGGLVDTCLPKIVPIKRVVRRMCGGSQAQLVQGQDSFYYVAKFSGNPQGNRTLINEWIAAYILNELGICTPRLSVLRLPDSIDRSDLFFYVGKGRKPVEGSLHLGSLLPVNPDKPIFDFLPRSMFPRISNISDFGRVFAFDCWLGQTDVRQAIYARRKGSKPAEWCVWMIDHGQLLGGSAWDLRMANGELRYFDFDVYKHINMPSILEQTVQVILALKEETLYAATEDIPEGWFASGDREALAHILARLQMRRRGLYDCVMRCWSNVKRKCA